VGGIVISLAWTAAVDLNLEVRDPVGGEIFFERPNTPSGGALSADVNNDCATAFAGNPTEQVIWQPGAVPTGSYEVLIYYVNGCTVGGPQEFTLTMQVGEDEAKSIRGTINLGQVYMASLVLDPSLAWLVINGGINAGLNISLLAPQIAEAQPFVGPTVTGNINRLRPAVAYTFQGTAGTEVAFTMARTSGSLDTYLILLGTDGRELARNDDASDGIRDSAIIYILPQDGTYTIVATRFGQTIGGTEGDFRLTQSVTTPTVVATTPGVVTTPEVGVTPIAGTPIAGTTTLPEGSIEVRLTWPTLADVQLLVRDPTGVSIFDDVPQNPATGGVLFADGNVGCTGVAGTAPVSYIYWPPTRTPAGIYEIEVWYQNDCQDTTPFLFDLNVQANSQEVIATQQAISLNQRYMITFEVTADGQVSVGPGGFFDPASSSTIDYVDLIPQARTITYNNIVRGNITSDVRVELFTFQGNTGDVVRIVMTRQSGTLDAVVYLIGPDGLQVAYNDDTPNQPAQGRITDSLIEGYTLTQSGTYYIIATHYGQQFGGTTGAYALTLNNMRR
jgi:hypothetical protein